MASHPLTDSQDYTNFFHSGILATLQYWGNHEAVQGLDVATLDREREGVITAISFGLDLEAVWSILRDLVIAFSPYMERRGYWQVWNTILSRAIVVAQRLGDVAGTITLSALLARLFQRQSRAQESIFYYRRTIQLSRQIDDYFNEARACTNLGYYYIESGYWYRAEVLCCHALRLFEQIGSKHGLAHTENHLGVLYTRQRRWQKAQGHLEQACTIWESMDDNWGLMYGFMNLGMLYVDMERGDEALIWSEKALRQAKLTGEALVIGTIYMNIGIAYRLKGEPAQAEAYAWRAEAVFQRFSNLLGLALVEENLGLACIDQGKWEEASTHQETALNAWRSLENKYKEIKVMIDIIEYELARENRLETTNRLTDIEQRLNQVELDVRYHHLLSRLVKYRRSLSNLPPGQATAV